MHHVFQARVIRVAVLSMLVVAGLLVPSAVWAQSQMHTSKPFAGPKANKGTVSHSKVGGKSVLTLSNDFVVPDTPDPHWAVVDSKGTMYLLDRLHLKPHEMKMEDHGKAPDRYQKSIQVPDYVKDVAKVVIWCAWAEANLGEAAFDKPVM